MNPDDKTQKRRYDHEEWIRSLRELFRAQMGYDENKPVNDPHPEDAAFAELAKDYAKHEQAELKAILTEETFKYEV